MLRYNIVLFSFLLFLASSIPTTTAAVTKRPTVDVSIIPLSESNIYHSFDKADETDAIVGYIDANMRWQLHQGSQLSHKFEAYMSNNIYFNYSNRNRSTLGVLYTPYWKYIKHGRFMLEANFSRRNKDLIDDSGQNLARTLKKWETYLAVGHRYDIGSFRLQQKFSYHDVNYDETDTLAVNGTDTTRVSLKSYDYHSYTWQFRIRYRASRKINTRFIFNTEKRYYDERRTYTIQYGAVKGRPFAIRNFRENQFAWWLNYRFSRKFSASWETEFTRRTDNFENYYGYDQWQHRLSLYTKWTRRHHTVTSFRFKRKDYPYYFTSRIPPGEHVSIEYVDFQLEHSYRLSEIVTLVATIRNYNKVSNDWYFDYHDFTAGVGVRLIY